MPSPFPGMDPWLEKRGVFPDLHNRFIGEMSAVLNALLPPPYFTAIATRVIIADDTRKRYIEPDVDIFKPTGLNGSHRANAGGGVATAEAVEIEPVIVHVADDEFAEWHLDVRTGEGDDELVTSIELLSPSNKRLGSEGRAEYLQKQREMRQRHVNLVEIDLLRGGMHSTAVPLDAALNQAGAFDYHVCVYRAARRRDLDVYPIRLPQKLPSVAVPLAPTVPAIPVNLQTIFDRCYDVGLYARRIKYGEPCDPPLTPEQQAWAENILREKTLLPK